MESDKENGLRLKHLRKICRGAMGRAEIKQNVLPRVLLMSDYRGIEKFVLSSLARIDPDFLPIHKYVMA